MCISVDSNKLSLLAYTKAGWRWRLRTNITIHHEGGIEKSVPRNTDWHHEACRVMTFGDCGGRIFLCHPHVIFLLTTKYRILNWKKRWTRIPENPDFPKMRHGDAILTLQWCHWSTYHQRAADVRLFFFYLSHGLLLVQAMWLRPKGLKVCSYVEKYAEIKNQTLKKSAGTLKCYAQRITPWVGNISK